jgi:ribonuclease P protein component
LNSTFFFIFFNIEHANAMRGRLHENGKMSDQRFRQEERLKSRKEIQRLFSVGQSFAQYPLRVVWTFAETRRGAFPARFALSVPRKRFKKAAERNRLRRQMREAWRCHKARLLEALKDSERQLAVMVLYTAAEALPFEHIEKAMRELLRRLEKKCLGALGQARPEAP